MFITLRMSSPVGFDAQERQSLPLPKGGSHLHEQRKQIGAFLASSPSFLIASSATCFHCSSVMWDRSSLIMLSLRKTASKTRKDSLKRVDSRFRSLSRFRAFQSLYNSILIGNEFVKDRSKEVLFCGHINLSNCFQRTKLNKSVCQIVSSPS